MGRPKYVDCAPRSQSRPVVTLVYLPLVDASTDPRHSRPRALFPVWDVLLSELPTDATTSPRLELLFDICAAMILALKGPLLRPVNATRPGKHHRGGLWDDLRDEEVDSETDTAFVHGLQM